MDGKQERIHARNYAINSMVETQSKLLHMKRFVNDRKCLADIKRALTSVRRLQTTLIESKYESWKTLQEEAQSIN